MQLIRQISDYIEEEIKDAEKYAENALLQKETNFALAKVYYDLSVSELQHQTMLHNMVANLIEDYRAKKGEPPADMLAVYEYLHKRNVDKVKNVRLLQAQYTEA